MATARAAASRARAARRGRRPSRAFLAGVSRDRARDRAGARTAQPGPAAGAGAEAATRTEALVEELSSRRPRLARRERRRRGNRRRGNRRGNPETRRRVSFFETTSRAARSRRRRFLKNRASFRHPEGRTRAHHRVGSSVPSRARRPRSPRARAHLAGRRRRPSRATPRGRRAKPPTRAATPPSEARGAGGARRRSARNHVWDFPHNKKKSGAVRVRERRLVPWEEHPVSRGRGSVPTPRASPPPFPPVHHAVRERDHSRVRPSGRRPRKPPRSPRSASCERRTRRLGFGPSPSEKRPAVSCG